MKELKLIIADDHLIVRKGVSSLLKMSYDKIEIKEVGGVNEIIPLLKNFKAQILLLDINIPGGNCTGMIKEIRQVNEEIYILMFSGYDESSYALRYIKAGANGFLSKDASEEEIIAAISVLLKTGKYISPFVQEKILSSMLFDIPMNPLKKLSKRELEVAELLTNGERVLEISNELHVQPSTISTYKNRIFEKLKVSNLVDLVELFKVYRD